MEKLNIVKNSVHEHDSMESLIRRDLDLLFMSDEEIREQAEYALTLYTTCKDILIERMGYREQLAQ